MKVQERSRLEKERTFKEIELVSQNYKKYADYYKRYLSEKNAFDRAQRDKITLYLKIENLQKYLREMCETSLSAL